MKNIYLTGMMGCGKTAIGQLFAQQTGREFVDTDELVESGAGMAVSEIFADRGEAYFRALESEALAKAAERQGAVVSCGGGMVLSAQNVQLMKQTGCVVYIRRDIEDIISTVNTDTRPLLKNDGSNIRALFERRRDIYESSCNVVLENGGTLEQAAQRLAEIAEDMAD